MLERLKSETGAVGKDIEQATIGKPGDVLLVHLKVLLVGMNRLP
jgi:hypothetical protein